jgi:hypothetical protein
MSSWIAWSRDGSVPLVRAQNERAVTKYVRHNLNEVSYVTDPAEQMFRYNVKTAKLEEVKEDG